MDALKYYVNPFNELLGEDGRMFDEEWDHNFVSICFNLETNVQGLRSKLTKCIRSDLVNPKSLLRVKVNPNKTYFYDDRSTSELIKKCIYQVDACNYDDTIAIAIQSGMAAVIVYDKKSFTFCGNHQVFDGVSSFNLIHGVFDNGVAFNRFPIHYCPILTETYLLSTIHNYWKPLYRKMNYGPHWRDGDPTFINRRHDISEYKTLKNSADNLSFTSVVVSKQLDLIFNTISQSSLIVGIVVAFENNTRFNNYGIIIFEMEKRSSNETLLDYAVKINEAISNKKHMALTSYVARNIHDLDVKWGSIDILFSGIPITKGENEIAVNGTKVTSLNSYLKSTNMPIYCMYVGSVKFLHISYTLRSPDIDINRFEEVS